MNSCSHRAPRCLNEYELIRKYRCADCGSVMMCACDEKIGRKCLSHQLKVGTELETQRRIPVTLGFQPNICRECRGLPPKAHPVAAIHGRTSKIRRYYWREIHLQTMERFATWLESPEALGKPDAERMRVRGGIEAQVLNEIKALHATSPKYAFKELSQAEIIEKCKVEVLDLKGTFVRNAEGGRAAILDGNEACGAEEFAIRHFRRCGLDTLLLESTPIHVLFGVFMWMLIQDPADPRGRIVGFGDRHAYEQGKPGQQIWTTLPEDFGTVGYGRRRAKAIQKHLELIQNDELEWLFDYWLPYSEELRQYLWAHREESVDAARRFIRIVPARTLKTILGYLVRNYWGRYVGWPDLVVYRGDEWFLAEVKASGDKLSEDQKRWIQDNRRYLHLPFKLVKIHKQGRTTAVA